MRALSIRQPWAWLIIYAGKNIENRSWKTKFRGRVLIHAAMGGTQASFAEAGRFAVAAGASFPHREAAGWSVSTTRGGIIGSVEIVDCVTSSSSPWWMGPVGFVLANPQPLPFLPCRGRLGFFDVPEIEP